jgi:phosphomevalonate kinase
LTSAPVVRAPGKVFLAGEYAVLEGGAAVVAAAARWASAQFRPGLAAPSDLVAAAVARARAALPEVAALPAGSAAVETDRFVHDGMKLGLGSSAAAAVAAAGAMLEAAGVSVAVNKELLFALADEAHRAAQGGVGSGADVAAAVHGGFVHFQRPPGGSPAIRALPRPAGLRMVVFWTRSSAQTPHLVREVRAFAARAPERHAGCIGSLRAAAAGFADAFAAGDVAALIRWADRGHQALGELGAAAGVPIVTAEVAAAAELARSLGGAAKPSGAGGGDLGVGFFSDADAVEAFTARCPAGLLVLDLQLGVAGAHCPRPDSIESFNKD